MMKVKIKKIYLKMHLDKNIKIKMYTNLFELFIIKIIKKNKSKNKSD